MTNLWWTSSRARLWKWIVRTGTPYHILLSAWPYFVFAQVSAVARILFPMATLERGEQLWKDPDNWLLWNPVDRKSIQRHGTDRHGDERKKQPLKVQFDQTFPPEHIKKKKDFRFSSARFIVSSRSRSRTVAREMLPWCFGAWQQTYQVGRCEESSKGGSMNRKSKLTLWEWVIKIKKNTEPF